MLRSHRHHLNDEQLESFLLYAQDLAELIASPLPDEVAVARTHLMDCPLCSSRFDSLGRAHRTLTTLRDTALKLGRAHRGERGVQCPSESQWPLLAACAIPDTAVETHLHHAAQCDYCGPLLRQALEDFDESLTPAENRAISRLQIAQAEGQASLAAVITGQPATFPAAIQLEQPGFFSRRFILSGTRSTALLAGALSLTALAAIYISRSNQTPERLLQRAYSQPRTLEMRISGGKYSPLQVERGVSSSALTDSPDLLRAEAEIAQQFRLHPGDPRWLRDKGEADLLDHNSGAAQTSLEQAHRGMPDDERISLDLASSYFLSAETQDSPQFYQAAEKLLRQIIAENPKNAEAQFNLAVVLERGSSPGAALDAWNNYLKLDPHSDWSQEAVTRRDELRKQIQIKY